MLTNAQMRLVIDLTIKQQLALARTEDDRAEVLSAREAVLLALPQVTDAINRYLETATL